LAGHGFASAVVVIRWLPDRFDNLTFPGIFSTIAFYTGSVHLHADRRYSLLMRKNRARIVKEAS